MCHPGERRQLRPDPLQQLLGLRLVADVGREDVDPAPVALRDLVDCPLCVRIGLAPAGQHDVAGPELGQVRRRVQAECTEATGDQIAPIAARLQRFRHLQHDLADVSRLLHAAERGLRLRQRVDLGSDRLQLAAGHAVRQLGQQAPRPLGFLLDGHQSSAMIS